MLPEFPELRQLRQPRLPRQFHPPPRRLPRAFLEFLSALITEFLPATTNEMALVETMVIAPWRLRRLWTLEAAIIIYEQRRQTETTLEENAPTRTMLAILALTPAQRESMSRDEARYHRRKAAN